MKLTTRFLLLAAMVGTATPAFGQGIRVGPDDQVVESTLSLPNAFYNENFGFAVGYVYGVVGRPQKQATLLAAAIAGSNGSAMGFQVGRDLQMPGVDRLFMDPVVSVGYFRDAEAFIDGNPDFPGERAGSNDSDPDNFIRGDDFDRDLKTNGLDFSVFWDNRDFYANPTRGFSLRGRCSRDFGWLDSSNSWTNVDAELDGYIPFQMGDWLRQGVLALNSWTSYSPTWDAQPDGDIADRPPAYTGSTLGGLWRMRGYPSQRFNDKAAVYILEVFQDTSCPVPDRRLP